jgi:hypothetical protein
MPGSQWVRYISGRIDSSMVGVGGGAVEAVAAAAAPCLDGSAVEVASTWEVPVDAGAARSPAVMRPVVAEHYIVTLKVRGSCPH